MNRYYQVKARLAGGVVRRFWATRIAKSIITTYTVCDEEGVKSNERILLSGGDFISEKLAVMDKHYGCLRVALKSDLVTIILGHPANDHRTSGRYWRHLKLDDLKRKIEELDLWGDKR